MATILTDKEIHDLETEHILLHLLFNKGNNGLISKCFPSMFSHRDNREIYEGIKLLNGKHDLSELAVILENKFGHQRQAVYSFFTDISISYIVEKCDPDVIIKRLKELLFRRLSLEKAQKIATDAEEPTTSSIEIFKEAHKIIALQGALLRSPNSDSSKIAKDTAEKVNTQSDIVRTGFPFINERLAGLTRKSISSLLAKPKHLKSTFCDALISETVENIGGRGLIISLEDPTEERVKRIIASRMNLSLRAMRFKEVQVDAQDIEFVLKKILRNNVYIYDAKDILTPDDAVSAIYDVKPDIVAVDHIQKFVMDDMVIGIIRAVKALEVAAIRNNCAVFITSQVSDKKFYGRTEQDPTASDAQWTSALYQSSSEMFSLYWHYQEQATKNPFEQDYIRLNILASRYSPAVGSIRLKINADQAKFLGEIKQEEL